jgi:hypothetical protein
MRFTDRDIPESLKRKMEKLQERISPEIAPVLLSVIKMRALAIQESDQRILDLLSIYEIDDYERLGEHIMHIVAEGKEIKAEADTARNKEWIIFKVTDENLLRRVYAFIGSICVEEQRYSNEFVENLERMGLVLKTVFPLFFIVEYCGNTVSGDIRIPMDPEEPISFIFMAQ